MMKTKDAKHGPRVLMIERNVLTMFEAIKDFLKHFDGLLTIQTFPDNKQVKDENKNLTNLFSWDGTEEMVVRLKNLNQKGSGVYFCVNELNSSYERRNESVKNIRAFFLDLDGSPLNPVLESTFPPDLIVRTSSNRFHCYWVLDKKVTADREKFRDIQRNIAKRFNGDQSINDLCRVMRVPCFYNMKKDPFLVKWIKITDEIKKDMTN